MPQARIRFSPDGRLLASMGLDGAAVRFWEVASGRLLRHVYVGVEAMVGIALTQPFTDSITRMARLRDRARALDAGSKDAR